MEKFSLYDFLGLLLPGVIFVFFCNTFNELFCIYPVIFKTVNLGVNIGISLCFAIIIGAVLYTSNFYLVNKKWYNKTFSMYKHVADLYLEMEDSLKHMNEILNQKAKDWYKKDIFFEKEDFDKLSEDERGKIKKMQGKYYNRMYSELVYHDKNKYSVIFHSFYFFFRQTALACIVLLLLIGVVYMLQLIPCLHINNPDTCKILWLAVLLFFMLFISVQLANWYRKRMVMKMYWAYYTHLNQTLSN